MGMGLGDNETVNFKLGAVQVDRIFLGSAYVWPNIPISNVVATDNLVGLVTITWSDTNEVAPNTYDLYADGSKIASNVSSPYDYTIDESTKMYSIRGLYGGGHFIGSNEDSGTSLSGIVPGPITDFSASDDQYYQVQCWWSSVSGDPVPTYDLYENGGIVAQNVASGHVMASAVGTRPWHVMAVNAEGETSSNIDNGTSLEEPLPPPSGYQELDGPAIGKWVVPPDVYSIVATIVGAGGSGALSEAVGIWDVAAGHNGTVIVQAMSVSPGQELTYNLGAGGLPRDALNDDDYVSGYDGEPTTFNGVTAAAGLGGYGDHYKGGESDTWILGSYHLTAYWGEPSGVGGSVGGYPRVGEIPTGFNAGPGTRGGGGGAVSSTENDLVYSGAGGAGYVLIEWG